MSTKSKRVDQTLRRKMRDAGIAKDVLPIEKLKELLDLWKHRNETGEYASDTCKNMIRMYELRIRRLEGNDNAKPTKA